MTEKSLLISDAARFLHVSTRTVYSRIKANRLHVKRVGVSLRVVQDELWEREAKGRITCAVAGTICR